jgi:hypothetical protein
MIKFVRNIRQNLLSDGKTGKYLKYAIGEIFLVVLGILIALSINNWNEDRKTANTEIEYLIRLRSDLANDTVYYHRRIKYAERVIADHKKAFQIAHTEIKSPRHFFESFNNLEWSSEFLSIRDITFNEMRNAGQLNIIRNDKVKTEILEFYRQVDLAEKHFEEINTTSIEYMSDFFIRSKAIKHFWSYEMEVSPWTADMLDDSEDWQWINDPKSENFKSFLFSLEFYSNKQFYFKRYFEDLVNKSTILLQEIENELKSRSIDVPAPSIEPVFVID